MATRKNRKKHDFEKLTEFDRAMRILVTVPKEVDFETTSDKPIKLTHFIVHPDKTGILGPDGKAIIQVGATLNLGPGREGHINGRRTVDIFVDYLP